MIHQLGRLCRNVELKTLNWNGENRSVLNNALAVRTTKKDEAAFVDITAWGKLAEAIAKYFKKGDEILITGELRNRIVKYGDIEVSQIFVLVHEFEFTYGKKNGRAAKSEENESGQLDEPQEAGIDSFSDNYNEEMPYYPYK